MGEQIIVHLLKLPLRIKAFTMLDIDGTFVITLNCNLTAEMQQKAYLHELDHILKNDSESIIDVDTTEKIMH